MAAVESQHRSANGRRRSPVPGARVAVSAAALVTLLVAGCGGHEDGSTAGLPSGPRPNVLLVVLDTVRADHLSCYGGVAPTPNLDALAARGVRFANAHANASWTLPSHASIFTGSYPVTHRATQETLSLEDRFDTLAEILTREGYRTFASSDNPIVSRANGLAQGFQRFEEVYRPAARSRYRSRDIHPNHAALLRFLDDTGSDRPFFAFLNYIEAHGPYEPPEPYRSRALVKTVTSTELAAAMSFGMKDHYLAARATPARRLELLRQLYRGEVLLLDDAVGELIDDLERRGMLENTLLVVTSDHGENLGEHGHLGHVFSIGNALLRVPLIVLPPDLDVPRVESRTCELIDLFPTILAYCGVPEDAPGPGRNLLGPDRGDRSGRTIAEYYYPRQVLSVFRPEEIRGRESLFRPFMRRLRAIQDGSTKFVWSSDGRHELYSLSEDPDETTNLLPAESKSEIASRWERELDDFVRRFAGEPPLPPAPPPGWMAPGFDESELDAETVEQLRSLGYVN